MSIVLDCSLRLLVTLRLIFYTLLLFEGTGIEAEDRYLPREEVDVLREIAKELGKKDWNFDLIPCDVLPNKSATQTRAAMPHYVNNINCSCNFSGNACHVVSLELKGQDLDGVLPPSLAKLPNIKRIDLSRNYLSGTIPPEWASTKPTYLSVMVNRLSGRIPAYLGNITSLLYMSLESNRFSGTVPAELGKLENLVNLILNANDLSGKLPMELNNLAKLQELRLSSNKFTGKIPSLESWSHLEKLEMEGSGLEGPIPESLSFLTNLTELRISDLSGEGSHFPNLSMMTSMHLLVLRRCNITGIIPPYISNNMRQLKHLDLSFNNLNGDMPEYKNLSGLGLERMYLTCNSLNGSVAPWVKNKDVKLAVDLSYNNFSEETVPPDCGGSVNLYRSYSTGNNSELGKCQSIRTCLQNISSVHINCGGPIATIRNKTYEADLDPGGPAKIFPSNDYWGYSCTGSVINLDEYKYIATNISILTMKHAQLYTNARLSPSSLTYYGRCLQNGKYTVTLHFAEIIFRSNRSYQSLGRRAFDVYVQGVNRLKNFDIKKEAGGIDKPKIKVIKKIYVNKGTLEIRFQYAGKGTSFVPDKGVFGPLISAISMEYETHGKKSAYAAIGSVAAVLCLGIIVLGIAWKRGYIWDKNSRGKELRVSDLQTGVFTYRQIKAATNKFADSNKLGEGGFGSVYKGTLLDGTLIAVKQLSSKSKQGNREFVNEIGMIAGIQHPNVVRLHGCCVERKQLLLVYEYMENNSLAQALFEEYNSMLEIDWATRQRICVGIAKGLAFLHEESLLKMVHRDIKATNILLDTDLTPKISDFGLAKLHEEENTHISTRVAGTIGYMAPEYALWGCLTYKADVYSFGVLAMEIVVGKSNMKYQPNDDCFCILDWAVSLKQKGSLTDLVDPRLGSEFNKNEAVRMIEIALLCTNESPTLRPIMSEVVNMLKGHTKFEEPNINANAITSEDEVRFQALGGKLTEMHSHEIDQTNTSISINPASSSSNDLYPDSQISQKC